MDLVEGNFAYGISAGSKYEGVIGWVTRSSNRVTLQYPDGRNASWKATNICIPLTHEVDASGVRECSKYAEWQRKQKPYKKRESYGRSPRGWFGKATVPPPDSVPSSAHKKEDVRKEDKDDAIEELSKKMSQLLTIVVESDKKQEEKMDKLDGKMNKLEKSLEGADDRMSRMEARMDAFEAAFGTGGNNKRKKRLS